MILHSIAIRKLRTMYRNPINFEYRKSFSLKNGAHVLADIEFQNPKNPLILYYYSLLNIAPPLIFTCRYNYDFVHIPKRVQIIILHTTCKINYNIIFSLIPKYKSINKHNEILRILMN